MNWHYGTVFLMIGAIICVIVLIAAVVKNNNENTNPTGGKTLIIPHGQQPLQAVIVNQTPKKQQENAKAAADQMNNKQMHRTDQDAAYIRRTAMERRVTVINTQVLNEAVASSDKIAKAAENIRIEVQRYCHNASYLQNLYRKNVELSNQAYNIRKQVQEMKDQLYHLSRKDSTLLPLFRQVKTFYEHLLENETELNNRNVTLRRFIGANFTVKEWKWNNDIEARKSNRAA